VKIPAEVNPSLMGSDDTIHFAHARVTRRVILTFNPKDFKVLHDRHSEHPGILAVYHDNNPTKDMSYAEIVRAIANLERSVFDILGGFWVLNAYRW
jgi:hypothetical protein